MARLKSSNLIGELGVNGGGAIDSQRMAVFTNDGRLPTRRTPTSYDSNAWRYTGQTGDYCEYLTGFIDADTSTSMNDHSGISIEININGTWTTVIKQSSVNGYPKFSCVSYLVPANTEYRISAWGIRGGVNQLKVFTSRCFDAK